MPWFRFNRDIPFKEADLLWYIYIYIYIYILHPAFPSGIHGNVCNCYFIPHEISNDSLYFILLLLNHPYLVHSFNVNGIMYFWEVSLILISRCDCVDTRAPLYYHGLTLISAWISNYIYYKLWGEITYPFLNFNGCTVEVYEWISNFIPHFTGHVITNTCWD